MMQGWIVEAPDPHGMVPTSTPYIYDMFGTIHSMLWMNRWIHNHATTTILVGAEFGELVRFSDQSGCTNDARVD
jgi:hypothetical protein